jgi:phosphatidate cytidylyltransferase
VITRIVVGLVSLPLVLALIWLGGVWCLLLILATALVGGVELFGLLAHGGYHPVRWLGLVWVAALVATGWQPGLPLASLVITAGLLATLIFALFQTERPVNGWLTTSGAAIYLGLLLGQTLALRQLPAGLWWFLFGLLITWTNDTAAYFAGVTVGRHRLWPRLSPKKTWEGTIAGWIGAALMGGLLMVIFPLEHSLPVGFVLGGLGGLFGLLGDLAMSMVKRQVGVKDSSQLIPGHGGVLDRLDSILFVMPLIYQVVILLGAWS